MFENSSRSRVLGSAMAPYFNDALSRQCGSSDQFLDNMFGGTNLVSAAALPRVGVGLELRHGRQPSGTGCIDRRQRAEAGNRLATPSIFDQVRSWRAYQEAMGAACNGSSRGRLRAEAQPAGLLHGARGACAADDLPIPRISCPTTVNTVCSTRPTGPSPRTWRTTRCRVLVRHAEPDQRHARRLGRAGRQLAAHVHPADRRLGGVPARRHRGLRDVGRGPPGQPQPDAFISPYTPPTRDAPR